MKSCSCLNRNLVSVQVEWRTLVNGRRSAICIQVRPHKVGRTRLTVAVTARSAEATATAVTAATASETRLQDQGGGGVARSGIQVLVGGYESSLVARLQRHLVVVHHRGGLGLIGLVWVMMLQIIDIIVVA